MVVDGFRGDWGGKGGVDVSNNSSSSGTKAARERRLFRFVAWLGTPLLVGQSAEFRPARRGTIFWPPESESWSVSHLRVMFEALPLRSQTSGGALKWAGQTDFDVPDSARRWALRLEAKKETNESLCYNEIELNWNPVVNLVYFDWWTGGMVTKTNLYNDNIIIVW